MSAISIQFATTKVLFSQGSNSTKCYENCNKFLEKIKDYLEKKSELKDFQIKFAADCEKQAQDFISKLGALLESKNRPLSVENLHLQVFDEKNILAILPRIQNLEKITIIDAVRRFRYLEIREISNLDQFQKAKELEISRFYVVAGIEKFLHFKKCIVDFQPEVYLDDET